MLALDKTAALANVLDMSSLIPLDLDQQSLDVLEAVFSRYAASVDECDMSFGDVDCLADDCSLAEDIVADCIADLSYLALIAELPDGCFVPTMKAEHYRASKQLTATL